MSQPDRAETERMQRDAEQRIRDMQRRSEQAVRGSDMPPVPNFVRTNGMRNNQGFTHQNHIQKREGANENNNKNNSNIINPTTSSNQSDRKKGFDILKLLNFKNLKLDNDMIIIIMLILLLSTEDTDELMLLALIYIML